MKKIAVLIVFACFFNLQTASAQSTTPSPSSEIEVSPSSLPSPSVTPAPSQDPSSSPTPSSTPPTQTGGSTTNSPTPTPSGVGGEVLGSATKLADTDSSKDWIKYALALGAMVVVVAFGIKLTREHVEE